MTNNEKNEIKVYEFVAEVYESDGAAKLRILNSKGMSTIRLRETIKFEKYYIDRTELPLSSVGQKYNIIFWADPKNNTIRAEAKEIE